MTMGLFARTVVPLTSQILSLLLSVHLVDCHPHFGSRIPNGIDVPNPGSEGGVWAGVGHINAGGGQALNPFGEHFAAEGFQWTARLCEMDSDDDGRTNGVELGDPYCQWIEGEVPSGPALSHPGIFDEPRDLTDHVSTCDNYVPSDDEEFLSISFSTPNELDETETHYRCEQTTVKMASPRLLHMTKYRALIDNQDIVHHMILYMCVDNESSDGNLVDQGPYKCSGIEAACSTVGGWGIGPDEICFPDNIGAEIDFSKTGDIVFKLEVHYDNSLRKPQSDASGIQLTLTPTLRPHKRSISALGFATLNPDVFIPPAQESFSLSNICPTVSTNKLDRPIFVFSFNPHMHRYGRGLVTEHYRCGTKIGEIGRIDTYKFDNQQPYNIRHPIKVLPGDALVTTCRFNTMSSEYPIVGGDETSNEMCLNFVSFYPHVGTESNPDTMSVCTSFEHGYFDPEKGIAVPVKFTTSARPSSDTVSFQYESDPLLNIADCCATHSCEQDYLAAEDGACGVDADCMEGLVCEGHLCAKPALTENNNNNNNNITTANTDGISSTQSPPTNTNTSGNNETVNTGLSSSSTTLRRGATSAFFMVVLASLVL